MNALAADLRATTRRRILKAGTISFGGGAITCTARNISHQGAMLDVVSPIGIPDRFWLVLAADHSSRPVVVVWRKDKRIGVRFENAEGPEVASEYPRHDGA